GSCKLNTRAKAPAIVILRASPLYYRPRRASRGAIPPAVGRPTHAVWLPGVARCLQTLPGDADGVHAEGEAHVRQGVQQRGVYLLLRGPGLQAAGDVGAELLFRAEGGKEDQREELTGFRVEHAARAEIAEIPAGE